VKPTTFVTLAFATLFAIGLSSCGQDKASETAGPAAPVNQVDLKINDYEKATNEYVRVAKRLKDGDLSLTVRYLDLEKRTKEAAAAVQQESPKMTPPQAQRVAAISARTAPYLQD
jgi:hypothetical protein